MSRINDILTQARQRAEQQGFNYSGDITPQEALTLLQEAPGTVLVDVRTRAEWDWVGRVPGAIEIDWVQYPDMSRNPQFTSELQRQVDRDATILFLCRSGVRSRSAASAAVEAGFARRPTTFSKALKATRMPRIIVATWVAGDFMASPGIRAKHFAKN